MWMESDSFLVWLLVPVFHMDGQYSTNSCNTESVPLYGMDGHYQGMGMNDQYYY